MAKYAYLLFLLSSFTYSCEMPTVEKKSEKTLWEQYGITTRQLTDETIGKAYLGEEAVNQLLEGKKVELPADAVHRILLKVPFKEEELLLATQFILLVSCFSSSHKNYFNHFDEKGRTPLCSFLLRREFLSNCAAGTTGSPVLSIINQMHRHTGIAACLSTSPSTVRNSLQKTFEELVSNCKMNRIADALHLPYESDNIYPMTLAGLRFPTGEFKLRKEPSTFSKSKL